MGDAFNEEATLALSDAELHLDGERGQINGEAYIVINLTDTEYGFLAENKDSDCYNNFVFHFDMLKNVPVCLYTKDIILQEDL